MDNVLDYIVSNYVWFLGGFIILTMMIIGYIADVTDFWHKKKENKVKEKKQENKIDDREGPTEEELDKLKNKTLGDAVLPNQTDINIDIPIENNNVSEVVTNEDLNAPFGDKIISDNKIEEQNINNEDLNVPLGEEVINTTLENQPVIGLSEDLNVPLEENNEVDFEQPVITSIDDLNAPLGEMKTDNEVNQENMISNINSAEPEVEEIPLINSNEYDDIPVENLTFVPEIEQNIVTPLDNTDKFVNEKQENNSKPLDGVEEVDYVEPIVPEFITETMENSDSKDIDKEEDIWKF